MDRPDTRTSLPSRRNLSNRGSEPYGSRMRFKVLGPLEVTGPEGPIPLGGPKQRAVLAHLLVRANELVPAEALIDQVWSGEPPDAARGTIHSYISHLRKALGPDRIEGRPPGYVLHLGTDELDAQRFERLLREARFANGSPGRAGNLLREALVLWTGPAFARPLVRAVARRRDRAARRAAPPGARGAHRRRPRGGPARRGHRRARVAHARAAAPRAVVGAPHAGAVPREASGRCARGVRTGA